jgi:hypothetical protein
MYTPCTFHTRLAQLVAAMHHRLLPALTTLHLPSQELEKFKFVLDYKIKELKKQIEPREEEIAEMKGQIKEMDGELERWEGRKCIS